MWRISIQDLRHRRRRFVLAVVATGLAFGMSLLMQGFVTTLGWESRHIVGLFGADEWVVAAGGTGPFTTMTFIDASVVDEFRSQPGVRAAGAFVQAREILHGLDTFVIGVEPGGLGVPVAADGRAPTAPGEVMTATMLGYHVGDEIQLAGRSATVVGTVADGTYYFGQPVVFALLSDVQDRYLAGQRIANGVAVSGTIEPPAGMPRADQQASDRRHRPTAEIWTPERRDPQWAAVDHGRRDRGHDGLPDRPRTDP